MDFFLQCIHVLTYISEQSILEKKNEGIQLTVRNKCMSV